MNYLFSINRRLFRLWAVCAAFWLMLCLTLCPAQASSVRFGQIQADRDATYLDLGSETVTNWAEFYDFLEQLPALRQVDLFATEIRKDRIEEMTSRFPEITFGMTMLVGDHVLRTDAAAFSTLHTPKSPKHGDDELSLVRYCVNLYALDLGHNRLSDLSFLEELPELRILIVAMNNVEDLTPVGSLSHLEYLEIFNNNITDISCLANLKYLTDVSLVNNRIADISPLASAGNLRRLWMRGFNRTLPAADVSEAAEMLRTELPLCEVDDRSFGVGGTWREHPHYDVIRRIFQTGVYEPFEDSPEENRPKLMDPLHLYMND